ncbi:S-adenosyl-L-methionine-dependent methyltransferase [Schizophyllum amplum]|uniref:S-adenosyl-L-methionine-dependent methyltransferase n=1 Tax=Schizophyllum amplum TaxID=97359 RepID=A0A550C2S5_9AGAR|nr:S-adenosyl-L-methionine-dependent methyltransferase [Auriculariopsis ampla]
MPGLDINEISSLQQTLNAALDAIKDEIRLGELPDLSSTATSPHPLDDPNVLVSPRLFEARRLTLASIGQIKYLLQVPYEKVVEQSLAPYDAATLDIFIRTGIVDIILANPRGASLEQISSDLDLHPHKVRAVLRHLSIQGWIREVSEDVYCANRSTLTLRPGQSGRQWAMTKGKGKVAGSLLDMITHPHWKHSTSITHTAFQLGHNTDLSIFAYNKEHPAELKQWATSVKTLGSVYEEALFHDYPWKSLKSTSFVDCAGGQGYLSISLAGILPSAHFVVQDLPEVISLTRENMKRENPSAVENGRLQAHPADLFKPQTVAADTYVLRYILHDWSDNDCVSILKNISLGAKPTSKILVIDHVASPAIVSRGASADDGRHIELDDLAGCKDYTTISAPPFIPKNFGAYSYMPVALGTHLMGAFNARERTLTEWRAIVDEAGLRILRVKALRAKTSVIELGF